MARDIAENPSNHFISKETGHATLPHGIYSNTGEYDDLEGASTDDDTCISIAGEHSAVGNNNASTKLPKELFELSIEEACPDYGVYRSGSLATRRISRLSSGGIVWVVAGNAAEWVKNQSGKVPFRSYTFSTSATNELNSSTDSSTNAKEFHLNWGPKLGTTLANIGNIFQAIHNGGSPQVGFFLRGGSANNPYIQSSIFDLKMDNSSGENEGGIRCIYRPTK